MASLPTSGCLWRERCPLLSSANMSRVAPRSPWLTYGAFGRALVAERLLGWSPLAGVQTQAIHTWTPTSNPTMVWRVSRLPLCEAWRTRRGRGVPDEFGQRLLGGHHERFVGFTCEHGVGDCCPICPHTMGRTKNHQAETNPVRLCRPCLCCQRLACCP